MKDITRHRNAARDEAAKEAMKKAHTAYYFANADKVKAAVKIWSMENPDKTKNRDIESYTKGGKYYSHRIKHQNSGVQGLKHKTRRKHAKLFRAFKRIIDPLGLSQIHHEWIPGTPNYRGVALVEKDAHLHGFINVIQILEGKITLLTEKDIRERIEPSINSSIGEVI